MLAEKSLLITDAVAGRLRRQGMTGEVVAGSGHNVFRDEHGRFMDVVEAWLASAAPAPASS